MPHLQKIKRQLAARAIAGVDQMSAEQLLEFITHSEQVITAAEKTRLGANQEQRRACVARAYTRLDQLTR